jgi:hypothetical protein
MTVSRGLPTTLAIAILLVCLAAPVSAKQVTRYVGRTSASRPWNAVTATVAKRDDGSRVVKRFLMEVTTTCDDGTTDRWSVGFGDRLRLGDHGQLEYRFNDPTTFLRIEGVIKPSKGQGTALLNLPRLSDDGLGVQLCTTGDISWRLRKAPTDKAPTHRSRPR